MIGLYRCISRSTYRRKAIRFAQCFSPYRSLLTLAIETSCDDTAVAILHKQTKSEVLKDSKNEASQGGDSRHTPTANLIFNKKITAPNTGLGGIHPIEALESHQNNLGNLLAEAIASLPEAKEDHNGKRTNQRFHVDSDGVKKQLPDFISVTRGPGMRTNLACGLDTAKGLATAWQIPLLGVHHMQAHALTPRLVSALEDYNEGHEKRPEFPFLTLLISGGHTMLLNSRGLVDHQILATTADVAIGDALDKCGRAILPERIKSNAKDTAFAKHLSEYGFSSKEQFLEWPIPKYRKDEILKPDNKYGWHIKAPLSHTRELAFSFTGIATSAEKQFRERQAHLPEGVSDEERRLFAQTSVGTAFEHLASRTIIALESLREARQEVRTLVVSGGVAANDFLRYYLRAALDVRGFEEVQLQFPPPWLCTDNAAMIAWCGMEMFEAGYQSALNIRSIRKWSMDPIREGGILGAPGWTASK